MKKRFSFAAAIWWVMACLIAGVFLMAASDKEERISEAENRMLAGFPKLSLKTIFNDEFTTGFDAFLSDAFFARDSVISFTNGLLDSFSMLSTDDTLAMQASTMEEDLQGIATLEDADVTQIPGVNDLAVEASPAESDAEDEEDEGIELAAGQIPITENNSYSYFKKTDGSLKHSYTYSRKNLETYAETLRIMQGYLPDDGQILFTQVPLASLANRWVYQQDTYCGWGSTMEMMLEDCLQGTERIHIFNTYEILEPYVAGDTPMFYEDDHHWSAEGAYKVFVEMMKKQGLPVIPYEEYEYKHITTGRDTYNVLYALLPAQSLVMTDMDVYEEIELMNYDSDSYRSFMNNTRLPWRKVITGANTGRNCLVICDSFGNSFTPYLLPYYNEVHMVDFREGRYSKNALGGSMGDLMRKYSIDDVYIITSTANGLRKDNSLVWLREYLQ